MFSRNQMYRFNYEPTEDEIQSKIEQMRSKTEPTQEPTEEPTIEPEPAPAPRPAPRPAPQQNPRETFAGQLAAAHGAGGAGFQRFGTEGSTPFRTPDFYRGRRTGAPDENTSIRLGRGAPMASRSFGGERDDESRAWRMAKLASKLPF